MRKCLTLIIAAVCTLCFMPAAQAQVSETPEVQIVGTIGANIGSNKDMDTLVKGYGNDAAVAFNAYYGGSSWKGSESPSKAALSLDAEFRIFFGNNFGTGFSVGYLSTTSKSKASSDYYANTAELKAKLTSVPLLLSGYYMLPLGEEGNARFVFGAGLGYYTGIKMQLTESSNDPDYPITQFNTAKAANTIGIHAKAEFQYVWSALLFNAGIMGRYAEFKEFKINGSTAYVDSKKFTANFSGVDIYCGVGLAL